MGMRSEICRLFKRITHCAEDSNFLRRLFSRESEKRYLIELLAMTSSASQIKQNHCPKNPPPKKKIKKIIQSAYLS